MAELSTSMAGPERIRLTPEVSPDRPKRDEATKALTFAAVWTVTGTDSRTKRAFRFRVESNDRWTPTTKGYRLALQTPRNLAPGPKPPTGAAAVPGP